MQAELVHARFAMAGVAGILLTDVSFLIYRLNLFICSFNCLFYIYAVQLSKFELVTKHHPLECLNNMIDICCASG